jgi:hypothetical protein
MGTLLTNLQDHALPDTLLATRDHEVGRHVLSSLVQQQDCILAGSRIRVTLVAKVARMTKRIVRSGFAEFVRLRPNVASNKQCTKCGHLDS